MGGSDYAVVQNEIIYFADNKNFVPSMARTKLKYEMK